MTADNGPAELVCNALAEPFVASTPGQLADIVANRVLFERAVGTVMLVYELDADNASELITWGSRALGITVGLLSRRLTEALLARTRGLERSAHFPPAHLRSVCDDVLFAEHERVRPAKATAKPDVS